jgi:hypothetical protein
VFVHSTVPDLQAGRGNALQLGSKGLFNRFMGGVLWSEGYQVRVVIAVNILVWGAYRHNLHPYGAAVLLGLSKGDIREGDHNMHG